MAEQTDRRMWLGVGALALGLLVAGGLVLGRGDVGPQDPVPPATQGEGTPKAPPVVADGEGGSERDPLQGNEAVVIGDGGQAAAERVAADSQEGPVGEVTAASLPTVAAPMPPENLSLIAPRFSPTGKRVVALSTGTGSARTAWVLESDSVEAGWTEVEGGPVNEVDWIDDDTLCLIRENQLFSYRIGGGAFNLVDPADEPGTISAAAAAPGGERVAYVSATTTNGGGDIRVVQRATSVVTNLTATRSRAGAPAWRADGRAVAGVVDGQVTAWAIDQSDPIVRHPRLEPARNPGFWGEGLQWQEGSAFVVDVLAAEPGANPRVLARQALASLTRPAPVVADRVWVASLRDPGTLWAIEADGTALVIDSDADYATQPDVVQRANGVWLAFTNNDKAAGQTRIHLGRLDPSLLVD